MPVDVKSGLGADWSSLVDSWERAAHLEVEQRKQDQGLVDFDSRIGRHRPKIGRCRLISTQQHSTHRPLEVQQGWAVPAASKVPGAEIKLFNLERWRSCVSKVSSSSVFDGDHASPKFRRPVFSKVPLRDGKVGIPIFVPRGMPVGDKPGLVADWSRLVAIGRHLGTRGAPSGGTG